MTVPASLMRQQSEGVVSETVALRVRDGKPIRCPFHGNCDGVLEWVAAYRAEPRVGIAGWPGGVMCDTCYCSEAYEPPEIDRVPEDLA